MTTESWLASGPQILDLDEVTSLQASLIAGQINVVGTDDDHTRIEVQQVRGRPVEIDLTDGHLTVGYHFLGWDSWLKKAQGWSDGDYAIVFISVPRKTPVKLGTVSAEGLLGGVEADCAVSTATGSIVADSGRGGLKANTVSGELSVRNHTGNLRVNSASGDVTAAGDLGRVEVSTVSGAVMLDLESATSMVSVKGVAANTTVRLPAGSGLNLKVRSVSGRVIVDGVDRHSGVFGISLDEQSGVGGCWLDVSSVSGNVTVLHRGETS